LEDNKKGKRSIPVIDWDIFYKIKAIKNGENSLL